MPAHRGRPKIYDGKSAEITFKIGETIYTDVARYAHEHGLSVPMYVAMMINLHVRGVKDDERRLEREATAHG